MVLGPSTRRAGFWLLDAIRGLPVRRQYDDVRSKMSHDEGSNDEPQDLLDHAARTTSFYAEYAGQPLQHFPVIDKAVIKRRFADFASTEFSGMALHYAVTSGSTGTPMRIGQDSAKRHRSIADLIYFNEMAGQRLGDPMLWMRAWSGRAKPWPTQFVQNIIPVELMGLDQRRMAEVVRTIRRRRVNCVLAYSSALWSLARFIEGLGGREGDFGLRVIIAGAESLQPFMKRRIEAAFGCPVVDRYANEENGVLASTRPDDDLFYLNRASYHFEFLSPDSDEPATMGAPARVVVTDLYNRAMPMIRYDTGDLAIVAEVRDGEPWALRSIEGRGTDVIYDTNGGQLSETVIGLIMKGFDDIAKYQLIQEDACTYRLLVCLGKVGYGDTEFRERLTDALGPGAQITVGIVDTIPNQPNEKFRPVLRRFEPAGPSPACTETF